MDVDWGGSHLDFHEQSQPKEEPANMHSEKEPMLSPEHIDCLEAVFRTVRYPSDSVIEYLADDLVVPMLKIKAWFRKKRGENKKLRKLGGHQMLQVECNPQFSLATGMSRFPMCSRDKKDSGISDVQQKLDNLNFGEAKDDRTEQNSNGNTAFIRNVLDSLIQVHPIPEEQKENDFQILGGKVEFSQQKKDKGDMMNLKLN